MPTAKKSTAKKSTAAKKAAPRKAAAGPAAKKSTTAAKKSSSSSSAAKKAATKKTGTRQPNAAFMKPMQPDAELSAVVGNKPMPRTEITKKLWAYIKKNDLQDPNARRMINADENLLPVFGGKKQVSMFDMTKLVNKHLKDS